MSKRQEALDNLRLKIAEDSKVPLWMPLISAVSCAAMALIFSLKEDYLFVVTLFLVFLNVLLVLVGALAITKSYMKPIVELWLAVESESAEEEKTE